MGFLGADAVEEFERALEGQRRQVREVFEELFPGGGSQRVLDLFQRAAPHLFAAAATRAQYEELATHLARAIDTSADPERAMNNLDRFVRGLGRGLLFDRP
jgi:hypothetical protein